MAHAQAQKHKQLAHMRHRQVCDLKEYGVGRGESGGGQGEREIRVSTGAVNEGSCCSNHLGEPDAVSSMQQTGVSVVATLGLGHCLFLVAVYALFASSEQVCVFHICRSPVSGAW